MLKILYKYQMVLTFDVYTETLEDKGRKQKSCRHAKEIGLTPFTIQFFSCLDSSEWISNGKSGDPSFPNGSPVGSGVFLSFSGYSNSGSDGDKDDDDDIWSDERAAQFAASERKNRNKEEKNLSLR